MIEWKVGGKKMKKYTKPNMTFRNIKNWDNSLDSTPKRHKDVEN